MVTLVILKNKHGKMSIAKRDHYSYTFVSMTTPCSIQIYDGTQANANQCFHAVEQYTQSLEKKYNFFSSDSYLSQVINNRDTNEVKIDEQTYKVLETVRHLSVETKGLFDITMGTLKPCYKKNTIAEVEQCLDELSGSTGLDSWALDDGHIIFKHLDTRIDLGGVIKEFSVDECVKIFHEYGISAAIVNFGGDMYALGQKPSGQDFMVAIKNPKDPQKNLVTVKLRDQALTTSASYERSTDIGGESFSHILSTTDKSEGILSATVISDSVLKSGIYSTSFMISTDIVIPDGLKVVLVDDDLRLHQNLQ